MPIAKPGFVPATGGINRQGNWMNRALGTLYDSVNMIPENMMLADDEAQSWATGALVPNAPTNSVPNSYFDNANHYPKYLPYISYNMISAGIHSLTVDEDKIVRRDGSFMLSAGASFSDVLTQPVHFKGNTYVPCEGWGGADSNGVFKYTPDAVTWVSGSPANMSLLTESKGRLYGAVYRRASQQTNPNRVYYSNTDGDFFDVASDTHDVAEGSEILNLFTLGDNLYAYHTLGITRILGDPSQGFTNDEVLTFNGGVSNGGKVSGFQDLFMFSIGSEPFVFDGFQARPVLKGFRGHIRKAQSIGGHLAAVGYSYRETTSKFRTKGFAYWDMLNDTLWTVKPNITQLTGSMISQDNHWNTLAIAKDTIDAIQPSMSYGVQFEGEKTGAWYMQHLDTSGALGSGLIPNLAIGQKYYCTFNPFIMEQDTIPRKLTVHAEVDTNVGISAYIAAVPPNMDGTEPTFTVGVLQHSDPQSNNQYVYQFPELHGRMFMYKIAFGRTTGSGSIRFFGIDPHVNIMNRSLP